MIVSFTKDLAKLFKLDLKIEHSNKFMVSPPLDDWVMGLAFSNKKYTGVFLIHRYSFLTLFVVSDKPDLTHCLNLFYEQLITIIKSAGLTDKKYFKYYDQLFNQINAVKHNNRSISSEIGNFRQQFSWFNEDSISTKQKVHSIDLVNKINDDIRNKFKFKTSKEVFIELLKKHHADPILISISEDVVDSTNEQTLH